MTWGSLFQCWILMCCRLYVGDTCWMGVCDSCLSLFLPISLFLVLVVQNIRLRRFCPSFCCLCCWFCWRCCGCFRCWCAVCLFLLVVVGSFFLPSVLDCVPVAVSILVLADRFVAIFGRQYYWLLIRCCWC